MADLNLQTAVTILLIAGALNWGAIAAANTDVVTAITGKEYNKYVYGLVGLAGLYAALQMAGVVKP